MKALPCFIAALSLLGGCIHSQPEFFSADGLSAQFPLQATALAEEAAVSKVSGWKHDSVCGSCSRKQALRKSP